MLKQKMPRFDVYACIDDSITWEKEGFDITATLVADTDSHVNDSECYSPQKIKQWERDEWFFVGVVLSVSKNGVEISDSAASLWGVDCNYNRRSNRHLSVAALDLESEALETARARASEIIAALSGAAA